MPVKKRIDVRRTFEANHYSVEAARIKMNLEYPGQVRQIAIAAGIKSHSHPEGGRVRWISKGHWDYLEKSAAKDSKIFNLNSAELKKHMAKYDPSTYKEKIHYLSEINSLKIKPGRDGKQPVRNVRTKRADAKTKVIKVPITKSIKTYSKDEFLNYGLGIDQLEQGIEQLKRNDWRNWNIETRAGRIKKEAFIELLKFFNKKLKT